MEIPIHNVCVVVRVSVCVCEREIAELSWTE